MEILWEKDIGLQCSTSMHQYGSTQMNLEGPATCRRTEVPVLENEVVHDRKNMTEKIHTHLKILVRKLAGENLADSAVGVAGRLKEMAQMKKDTLHYSVLEEAHH